MTLQNNAIEIQIKENANLVDNEKVIFKKSNWNYKINNERIISPYAENMGRWRKINFILGEKNRMRYTLIRTENC